MAQRSVLFCALTVVLTAHQRQINNSITSKDIVLSEVKMSVIFTDLNSLLAVTISKPGSAQFLCYSC